jgi:mannosyltransferase
MAGALTMVLAALGFAVLRPSWRLPALAAVLALSLWSVASFYRSSTEDWRGMLAGLRRDARPGDLVLAFPNEVQMPVSYYMKAGPAVTYLPAPFPARGLARPYTGNAGAPNIAPEDIPRLRAMLWGRRRVWLIERRADSVRSCCRPGGEGTGQPFPAAAQGGGRRRQHLAV